MGESPPSVEEGAASTRGSTTLTLLHYINNTQTFVLKYKDNRTFSQERRVA
jgi:hypothetical protein